MERVIASLGRGVGFSLREFKNSLTDGHLDSIASGSREWHVDDVDDVDGSVRNRTTRILSSASGMTIERRL